MNSDMNENLVPVKDACPSCHERDVDQLVWIDDEKVQCATCGTVYSPLAKGGDDEA